MHIPNNLRPKFIASLTFRGFEMPPTEVESLVGKTSTDLGVRGMPRKQGPRLLERSFATWKVAFSDSTRIDEMVPALIESIGGVDHLLSVRDKVMPEFFEIDLSLWIKDSDEQEGGFIDHQTIDMLSRLGVTLSFGFYSRNDTQASGAEDTAP